MKQYLVVFKENKIIPIRELSQLEYEEYNKAILCLTNFSSDQELFTIVSLNYFDYKNVLNRYFEEYSEDSSMSFSRMEGINIDLNRNILNFLSAVRTYTDHSETNLKKRYGKDSQKVGLFKEACNKAYDNCFSYRFLSILRNYVQHFGMPVGEISLQKSLDPLSNDIHHTFEVKFDRDELLRYDKWKKLKNEIQKLPSKIEITQHITKMKKCIERINFTLIEDDLPELIQSAEYIKKLINENKDHGVVYISRTELIDDDVKIYLEHMPFHLIKKIDAIKKKYNHI